MHVTARHDAGHLSELLEPFLVFHVAVNDVVAQNVGGPTPQLHAALGFRAITDGRNHVKGVVLNLVCFTVSDSCRKFCDNYPR